jgi:hypothetical protein
MRIYQVLDWYTEESLDSVGDVGSLEGFRGRSNTFRIEPEVTLTTYNYTSTVKSIYISNMILIPVIEVMGDSGGDERMFSAIE